MTKTFTKILFATVFLTVAFGVFGLATNSNIINNANAQTSCGNCGGGNTGGGSTGGDGGGSTVPAPTCNISTNVSVVNSGDQYTISWNGTPSNGTFEVNNYPVQAVGQKTYTFTAANYSRFVFTGRTAGGTCVDEVRVTRRVVEAPRCESFTATPATLPAGGGSVNLRWDTTNATNATLDGQPVAGDGTLAVNVTANKTFTLNLSNSVGQASCTAPVTVATPVPTPVCTLTGAPHTITRGSSAELNWTSQNGVSSSFNQGIGSVSLNGNRSVSPNETTTYTFTVRNNAGVEVVCNKTITVQIPTPLTPICDSFTANASTINRGQSSVLTWNTTNVNSVSINNAIGSVGVDGNVTVSPLQTITYTLTGTGANNQQVSCPVTITVNQPDAAITCAANVNFSANNNSIRRGDSSTLTWSTNGLANVRFDNLNSTGLSGSINVNPTDSITYTLIGTKGSQTINCPVTISVSSDNNNGGGGGGSSAVKCSLKISDNKISRGDRVTLKWDTTRATEVTIKDNHGKTLIDTDGKSSSQKKDLYDGELTLRPEKDTTYTLVAEKGSKDKTCKVTVDVEDTVVVTQVRDQQPLVTGIALTNVPYTGFEAGPFMTSVFYTLLAAWALYMAYVLVGRRNGMNVSAFTPATVTSDIVPSTMLMPEKVTAAPAFYQVLSPVAATTATVGYEAHTEANEAIEAQAHAANVLLSTDAIAYFVGATANEDRTTVLAQILTAAKASYPSEEGWVVISADRMVELAAKF